MNKRENKTLDALSAHVISEFVLFCGFAKDGLQHKEAVAGCFDQTEALDYFYEHGWRVIRGKVACPDCAKLKKGKA